MESKRAKELAEAHWNGYVGPLVETHSEYRTYGYDEVVRLCKLHYITSGVHFYGHAIEDERSGLFRPRIGVEQYPPAHPYYHKDELSKEEIAAINAEVAPPPLCDSCLRVRVCELGSVTGCKGYLSRKDAENEALPSHPSLSDNSCPVCGEQMIGKPRGCGVHGFPSPADKREEPPTPLSLSLPKDEPYTFPAAKKFMNRNALDYIDKLREEINEVVTANKTFDVIVELFDVAHVAETAIRSLSEEYGVDVMDARDHCEAKNRARGYYEP